MIKAICFDFFFTLIKPSYSKNEEENEYNPIGLTQEIWEQYAEDKVLYNERACGKIKDSAQIIADILMKFGKEVSSGTHQYIAELRERRFENALKQIEPSIIDTLSTLRTSGYKLCLISNADVIDIKYWHQSPLAPYFDQVVFSCEIGSIKPNKKIYQTAIERLDINANQCIFVGDGGSNELQGAKSIGMTCILTEHFLKREGEDRENIVTYADYAIKHISELPELLNLMQREQEGE